MNTLPAPWMTAENIALMTEWWEQGLTSSEIANQLTSRGYAVTRNAVIGKVYRLGLCHNLANKPEQARKIPRKRAAPKNIPRAIRKLPISRRKVAFNRFVKKAKLNGYHCRGGDMVKEPDPTKQIPLIETKEGDCRAIVGYLIEGKIVKEVPKRQVQNAICCGEKAVMVVSSGKLVHSAWCAHHHDLYTMEPRR